MRALIYGTGGMGRGIRAALEARGDTVAGVLGRPAGTPTRPDPTVLGSPDVAFEFSHASSLLPNLEHALATGCRRIVIGTTGWSGDDAVRAALAQRAGEAGAAVVAAPTFSPAAVLFGRLAEEAARLFGGLAEYDPYIFEWHRRNKPDRPSGTALALARRVLPHLATKRRASLPEGEGPPGPETLEIVALRAGAAPGTHVFGFDSPGESIEVRVAARDRSAYISGALLAADWLLAGRAPGAGVFAFDAVLDDAIARRGGDDPPGDAR